MLPVRYHTLLFLPLLCTLPVFCSLTHKELAEELEWRIAQLPHHRDKRFVFLTDEKRFVMPPGSQMVFTPTLALPVIRYPPTGLDANMTLSTPFTLHFDSMGLTDNKNPFGLIPQLNSILGSSIFGRRKRSVPDPEEEPSLVHGGERAFLYEYVENFLFNFGLDGKGCLLRAICETHETPLLGHGMVGEILELFLTPTKSPYWNRMTEYINAEMAGREGGDCRKFEKDCAKSLYKLNKYSKAAQLINPRKQIQLEDFLSEDLRKQFEKNIQNSVM